MSHFWAFFQERKKVSQNTRSHTGYVNIIQEYINNMLKVWWTTKKHNKNYPKTQHVLHQTIWFSHKKCVKLKRFNTRAIHPHQFTSFLPFLSFSSNFHSKGHCFTKSAPIFVFMACESDTFLCHILAFMAINLSNYFAISNDAEQNFWGIVCSKSKKTLFRLFF